MPNRKVQRRKPLGRASLRKGAVIVETAICLPFIFLLVAASIELSAGLHQQLIVRETVHECATRAAAGTCTSNEVQTVAQQILSQRGFSEFEITITEVPRTVNVGSVQSASVPQFVIPSSGATTSGLENVPRGTILRLELVADRPPIAAISILSGLLNSDVAGQCVFVKEK